MRVRPPPEGNVHVDSLIQIRYPDISCQVEMVSHSSRAVWPEVGYHLCVLLVCLLVYRAKIDMDVSRGHAQGPAYAMFSQLPLWLRKSHRPVQVKEFTSLHHVWLCGHRESHLL